MRKIRIFEHISLDGVIEHDGDYTYGAWTTPYRSPAGAAMLLDAYGPDFDLLLVRFIIEIAIVAYTKKVSWIEDNIYLSIQETHKNAWFKLQHFYIFV